MTSSLIGAHPSSSEERCQINTNHYNFDSDQYLHIISTLFTPKYTHHVTHSETQPTSTIAANDDFLISRYN